MTAPARSLGERLRTSFGVEEWETLIGGSILNKFGALIFVIGVALFLGYSFTHMQALGRAATAIVVSLSILGAGVWTERKPRYRVFARGLIAAGWAAIYATSYAIYAIPEARIIDSPLAGSLGLVLVACGMIGHSLRYRSQSLTGVAYFAAFAALSVNPSSPFAVVSLIPLAASILFLAWKLDWHSLALYGVVATYLTCISRGQSGAPLSSTESLFLAYWILFEMFDLLRMNKRVLAGGVEWIFPLNTAGFLGLSYLAWNHHAPDQLWFASACAAALFLADAIGRFLIRLPGSFAVDEDLFFRMRSGSFEPSILVSALLAGMAVIGRVPGIWTSAALALEAEILYLAGVRFGSGFLRGLGSTSFAFSLGRLFVFQFPGTKTDVLGHATWTSTPVLLFHSVLFGLNQMLRRTQLFFGTFAIALTSLAIGMEVREPWLGMTWILLGAVLLEIPAFRFHAYVLLAGGSLVAALVPLLHPNAEWSGLAISLGVMYWCTLRKKITEGAVLVTLLAVLLVWRVSPMEHLALAWAALGLVLFELGNWRIPSLLRLSLMPMAAITIGAAAGTGPHASDYLGMALIAALASARLTLYPASDTEGWERGGLRDFLTILSAFSLLMASSLRLPEPWVAVAWVFVALALSELGLAGNIPSFHWIGLGTMAAAYGRVVLFDLHHLLPAAIAIAGLYWQWFRTRTHATATAHLYAVLPLPLCVLAAQLPDERIALGWMLTAIALLATGLRHARFQACGVAVLSFWAALWFDIDPPYLWISIPVVILLYFGQWIAGKKAAILYSLLGTALVSAILYGRVSGGLLTVALGLQGLMLLGAGFPLHQRVLRLQGLAVFLACILKLFVFDLRNLETLYRILSFVVLGLLLLAVSWIYTRFREDVSRML